MHQIMKIESVPIKLQFEMQNAELQIHSPNPKLTVVRNAGGLSITTQPARVSISNRGLKESIMAMKPFLELSKEQAAEGIQAAQEATAEIAEEGNASMTMSIADIKAAKLGQTPETVIVSIPQDGPEISASAPVVDIRYTPDEVRLNWELQSPEVNYTPYKVNFQVTQYPQVNIEFVSENG